MADLKSWLLPPAVDLQPISPTSERSQMQILAFRLKHIGSSHLLENNSAAAHRAAICKKS